MADMQFWSAVIPGGGSTTQDIEQTQDTATYLHLTNVALAGDGANSSHVVSVVVNGKECILATLQRGACMQHQLDMLLDETVTFKNSGPGVVHVGGYITFSSAEDADDDEEDEDEDEDEEDDEEAPEGVPLHNGKVDRKMLMKLLGRDSGDDEDDQDEDDEDEEGEDEDEDEDEDDEDDGRVKASQRLQAALDAEGDDDFEIDSDDIVGEVEDGEDEDGEDGEDEDGEDEDEEGEDEEEDEDEEEEEEEEEEEQPKGKAGVKRIPVASTPAPASKKAKVEAAKAPASAPPKMQKQQEKQAAAAQKKGGQAPAAGGDAAKAYEKALIDYLAKQPNKTAKMAQLGSSVKRPDGVPKMAAFLQSRANLFKQDVKAGTVMLTK